MISPSPLFYILLVLTYLSLIQAVKYPLFDKRIDKEGFEYRHDTTPPPVDNTIEDALDEAALEKELVEELVAEDAASVRQQRQEADLARQKEQDRLYLQQLRQEAEEAVALERQLNRQEQQFARLDPEQQNKLMNENFDPSRADPKYSITCKGRRPGWALPIFAEWNPNLDPDNDDALQLICAKPQYGGKPPGQWGPRGIPGFCNRDMGLISILSGRMENPTPEMIREYIRTAPPAYSIDSSTKANIVPGHGTLRNPRLELLCARRCWCSTWQGQSSGSYPFKRSVYPVTQLVPAASAYHITIDDYNDFTDTASKYPNSNRMVEAIQVRGAPQVATRWHNTHRFPVPDKTKYWQLITVDDANSIECDDNVPLPTQIPMMYPLPWSYFKTTTGLCATTTDGGKTYANAASFCRKPFSHYQLMTRLNIVDLTPIESSSIWWSDEFSPRLEWTWQANYNFIASIRFHCFQNCWCKGQRARRMKMDRSFLYLTEETGIQKLSTGLRTLFKPKGGGSQKSTPTGPQDRRDGRGPQCNTANTCANSPGDESDTCANNPGGESDTCANGPGDVNILGPVPGINPPMGKPIVRPSPENAYGNLAMCGKTCSGPAAQQCSEAGWYSDCECVVPPTLSIAKLLGTDPVGTFGLCLQAVAIQGILRHSHGQNSNLPKRELEEVEDDWPCPCNTTYVSKGCCGSRDGIIWEDPRLRMKTLLGDL